MRVDNVRGLHPISDSALFKRPLLRGELDALRQCVGGEITERRIVSQVALQKLIRTDKVMPTTVKLTRLGYANEHDAHIRYGGPGFAWVVTQRGLTSYRTPHSNTRLGWDATLQLAGVVVPGTCCSGESAG